MGTMINVDSKTPDRLAGLAEARGTTMRALVEEFAESTLTPAEMKEHADRTAAYLAEHLGVTVTDESSAEILRGVRSQVVAHHAAEPVPRDPGALQGIAVHVGQLGIPTVDLDYPAALSCCQLHACGVPFGRAAAIEAARRIAGRWRVGRRGNWQKSATGGPGMTWPPTTRVVPNLPIVGQRDGPAAVTSLVGPARG
ncbi:hypothetical protein E0500_015445 [Streptomyces sp. KM273126]|uniref:hypothetical protein n=1 Tax=Streptomyces sp. KM273126 TaxID=2545247 RepID=UPI0015EBA48F|nr:hypothetical protein [Streptomyces sp. KM273126]MBA2808754.1 hypothetical protein [Streptomyces sp. KM273126]